MSANAPIPGTNRLTVTRPEAGAFLVLLLLFNAGAWLWAWAAFDGRPTLLGTALLAWVFGLRHALDADHIAAIDNVVRKLMQEGRRAVLVGFFFSLGHSTVVVLASVAVVEAAASMQGRLEAAKAIGGMFGTVISATFLLLVALINLVVLRSVWRDFRRQRHERPLNATVLHGIPHGSGVLASLFHPLFRAVTRPWQMYLVGFLFGLGFDTATEIGLLGISGAEAARGLSAWQILVFPALFTVGMTLVDTGDSVLMASAYGWAFDNPARKLWYNLTITGTSVLVALLIGGAETLGLIGDRLGIQGGWWSVVADVNDNLTHFGFAVVGVFALGWVASALIYHWKR